MSFPELTEKKQKERRVEWEGNEPKGWSLWGYSLQSIRLHIISFPLKERDGLKKQKFKFTEALEELVSETWTTS